MATVPTDRDGMGRTITRHRGEPIRGAKARSTATRTAHIFGDVDLSHAVGSTLRTIQMGRRTGQSLLFLSSSSAFHGWEPFECFFFLSATARFFIVADLCRVGMVAIKTERVGESA